MRIVLALLLFVSLITSGDAAKAQLVYGGGTETGSRFNPGVGVITYMNCFTTQPGSTLQLDNVQVGIRRGPVVGTLVEVGVNIYAAQMTFDGTNFGRGANFLIHSTTLAATPSAGFVTELVNTPSNLGTSLSLETVSNPGFGGWWIGVEFTGPNAANTSNGWRVVNAPTTGASINGFGLFNNANSGIFEAFFGFASAPGEPAGSAPSRFLVNVNGQVVTAPSATVDAAYVVHNGFSGAGSPNDSSKVLYKETATPTALTYDNLINSSRGINGIGFNISGTGNAAAITAADFVFEVSQIPFTSGNPNWIPAPAPASVVVTPGTPDQIVVSWSNNAIANRWLKATVLGNANTGLAANEVYYIGHLLGESGPAVPTYTVAFADITPIRAGVGSTVGSESPLDIDKNGTVTFADISAMRANVGAQLGNLTVPPPAP